MDRRGRSLAECVVAAAEAGRPCRAVRLDAALFGLAYRTELLLLDADIGRLVADIGRLVADRLRLNGLLEGADAGRQDANFDLRDIGEAVGVVIPGTL